MPLASPLTASQGTDDIRCHCTPYVDPFIGTGGHGHVYPGATVPWGMVQLSPDQGQGGWDWIAGYNWEDSLLVGFSHTHLSGTGIGDLLDVLVMPVSEYFPVNEAIGGPVGPIRPIPVFP